MNSRVVVLFIFCSFLWSVLVIRAASLQIVPDHRLTALQKRQFDTVVTLKARRGDVVDRNGNELAVSLTAYSLFADPKLIDDPVRTAKILSAELNQPYRSILAKLTNKKTRFIWLARWQDRAVKERVDARKIEGVRFIEESKRVYPNEHLLAHVLGFVGQDGKGLEGLEAEVNDQLEGTDRKVNLHKDRRGRPLVVNGQIFSQAPDGADVQLTIDRDLQFILEQELRSVQREQEAESAVGVILDANTAEVLAMAATPTFDPNKPSDFSADHRRNRVLTDSFEPGSTMKPLVVASALSRGLIEPDSKFDCENGVMKIGKRTIREADAKHRFGILSVSEILAYSSNIGVAKIGFKLGDQNLHQALMNFGIGERTGIDLPGEVRGIVNPLPWRDHLLSNISFGHGITVTPMQVAVAYAALVNGGWVKRPYIVKQVTDHDSNEVIVTGPKTLRRVLTDEQSLRMRMMLMGATAKGATGFAARVPGYPIGGKTGTAQKVMSGGKGYMKGGYISSFAGFLPVQNPKFVIYVSVDSPKKDFYGSAVAAPVFSKVARYAVRRFGLQPILIGEENVLPSESKSSKTGESTIRKPVAALAISAKPTSVETQALVPDAVSLGLANVIASGSSSEASGTVESGAQMPDLKGLSLREALQRVRAEGLDPKIHGTGIVSMTYPAAGAPIVKDQTVNLYLQRQ